MKMKTKSQKMNSIWARGAIGFAMLLLFAAPQRVVAQWTTGTNISNTNTGNVGIGTASPGKLLTVNGDAGITTLYGNSTSQNANDSLKLGPGRTATSSLIILVQVDWPRRSSV